jgi:hypothetical protein
MQFQHRTWIIAALAVSWACSAVAKPIPSGPTVSTQKNYLAAVQKHYQRTVVEAYSKFGVADPKLKDTTLKFLGDYVAWVVECVDVDAPEALVAEATQASSHGCTDPLVLSCAGNVLHRTHPLDAERMLLQAQEGFRTNTSYPRCQAFLVPVYLRRAQAAASPGCRLGIDEGQIKTACAWAADSFRDGSFSGDSPRVAFNVLCLDQMDFLSDRLGVLYENLKRAPKVDPYVLRVIGGNVEIEAAWEARGSGFASTVSDVGWKKFGEHLTTARKLLTEAWQAHPGYPEAPTAMITVAKAGYSNEGEGTRFWFDRAASAQFDYMPAYRSYETDILPRWHGSVREMYNFGAECLKTGRFDTSVPWEFLTMLRSIEVEMAGDRSYWVSPESETYLKKLFDGYEQSGYGHSSDWYKTARAATTWVCGHPDQAKSLLDALGPKAVDDVFPILFKVSAADGRAAIQNGWIPGEPLRDPASGHYYKFCKTTYGATWDEARRSAATMLWKGKKGHLVTITSDEESSFVSKLPKPENAFYWLGGTKVSSLDDWTWTTGEKWSYTAWAPQRPATLSAEGERLFALPKGFGWGNVGDQQKLMDFVVEYE